MGIATTPSPVWTRLASGLCGGVLLAGALLATHAQQAAAAALGAGLGLWLLGRAAGGHRGQARAALRHAWVAAMLALAATPGLALWQTPQQWTDLLHLTPLGAALALAAYSLAAALAPLRRGEALPAMTSALLLAVPFVLFNGLFTLAAQSLPQQIGAWLALPATWQRTAGTWLVLGLAGEFLVQGLGLLMDRRSTRGWRLHALLWTATAWAALTPRLAETGSGPLAANLPTLVQIPWVMGFAAAGQAGLWGLTFLLTGLLLDGLRGYRPTALAATDHWRSGAGKGAVYSAWFMALIHGAALLGDGAPAAWLTHHGLLAGVLLGAALFPLAATVIETFDGSPPLVRRLLATYRQPVYLLRGAVAGLAVALWLQLGLTQAGEGRRLLLGALAGASVYAGVTLLLDVVGSIRGWRPRPQRLAAYAVMAAMGGVTGGLLAWYFDARQLAVVLERFAGYATVHYPNAGRGVYEFIIYPLFSKWGATDLGTVSGGVKLFYAQSLSGVVQWALAAPLFSLNLVLLTALIERRLRPIRATFSRAGLIEVGAQTVRVLRWGLWMAPIIASFLRLAPDPTWYNQDGAVRSVLATVQQLLQPDTDYRAWSLQLFLGLLAYDWLRVLIWFDHMGLRVASLVNFSFVGMDAVDARLARALGHGPRGQVIPEGLRRFATWAPLLVPFYIPRNGEWDQVWSGAEQLQQHGGPLLPAVNDLLGAYAAATVLAVLATAWVLRGAARSGQLRRIRQAPRQRLGNGRYQLHLGDDGRGYARVRRAARGCPQIALTRPPEDDLDRRGRFFYVVEDGQAPWSLTREPCPRADVHHAVVERTPNGLVFRAECAGLTALTRVQMPAQQPLECWTVTLANPGADARRIRLVSFLEPLLDDAQAAAHHPAMQRLYLGTHFVAPLAALMAHNRNLTDARGRPAAEVAFHAAATVPRRVELTGYEDSRGRFLGAGGPARPDGLAAGAARAPEDQGLLYGFDPAMSLTLTVTVPPRGRTEVRLVTGFAADADSAAHLINRCLGTPLPAPALWQATLARRREVRDAIPPASTFAADGWTLGIDGAAARPYSHVIANARGHGAVLDSAGNIAAFAGNSQQNALTPFRPDNTGHRLPGEAFYVLDLASGRCASPTFAPLRDTRPVPRAHFAPGEAQFAARLDTLELELTVTVVPDAPVQLRLLRLINPGTAARRVRVLAYLEWVLAELPSDSRGRLQLRQTGSTVYCRHPDNLFVPGWAFATCSMDQAAVETVRSRFVATAAASLPCFAGPGGGDLAALDDGTRIAAFSGEMELPAGGEYRLVVALGQAPDLGSAQTLAERYRVPDTAWAALAAARADWRQRLGVLQVETGIPAFDRLVNTWLPYQAITARLWARCGPEQRSGAYGFRDQLQDVLPLLVLDPALAREQILRHAGQQFPAGDVLHWWHPTPGGGTGFGARTRASDPPLWLPYLTSHYLTASGDGAILDQRTPFLESRRIPQGADGLGFAPRTAPGNVSLWEHCRRAIDCALARRGRHGLPLIGSGDWNDALDRVGHRGRGESVWLGFFLHRVLVDFAPLAQARGDSRTAARWQAAAAALRQALAGMRRDARWVRAVRDDGSELLHANALTAAWPALSGAVPAADALAALEAELPALETADLVRVQWPPFDADSTPWPGRIALYPPGVRENGGQYSHGASWLVDALLTLADADAADPAALRQAAWRLWQKISPLDRDAPDRAARYGLAPHQQPADIYSGDGLQGRGGWSWYTGAAARMLWTAYGLLGLRLENGELRVGNPATGALRLRRLHWQGRGRLPDD